MKLSDYDIHRIATAVVEMLTENDKFTRNIAKAMPRKERMITSSQAARMLGLTRKTVCNIASHLGGIKGAGNSAHWYFREGEIAKRYQEYLLTKN